MEYLAGIELGWIALFAGTVGGLLTLNAYYPLRSPSGLATVSFFAGWLVCELAAHHLIIQFVAAGLFVYYGALDHWTGWVAFGVSVASWASLMRLHRRGQLVGEVASSALRQGFVEGSADGLDKPVGLRNVVSPFSTRHRDVERIRDIVFANVGGKELKLDIFRPIDCPADAPVLLFLHGGAWVFGYKEYQGLPMFSRMSSQGWICITADYRLSPRATFPDHVEDVKRAIVWTKKHIAEYNGDPNFIVLAGSSAGGHLASLAALTWDEIRFQRGFEDADTRVQGCVSFYGVYDFLNRFGHWPHKSALWLLERVVMKTSVARSESMYRLASPIDQVRPDAPPFLVIHGDRDTVVPVEEGRRFGAALKAVSTQPVIYVEIPDAQHAFEMFRSVRGHHTLRATASFLRNLHSQYRQAKDKDSAEACTV